MISRQEIIENLKQSLGQDAVILSGWVKGIKDFTLPVVSVTTYENIPNSAVLNIWTCTINDRDKITERVVKEIESLKNSGVRIERIQVIGFEEKGILQPGTWKVIKNSKPIFRKEIWIRLC